MNDDVGAFTGEPLGLIGANEPVSAARTALGAANALLVTDEGKPVAVLTRQDLLNFLSA
jgi:cystathionine beta-synthase